jgi:hypothetical protein
VVEVTRPVGSTFSTSVGHQAPATCVNSEKRVVPVGTSPSQRASTTTPRDRSIVRTKRLVGCVGWTKVIAVLPSPMSWAVAEYVRHGSSSRSEVHAIGSAAALSSPGFAGRTRPRRQSLRHSPRWPFSSQSTIQPSPRACALCVSHDSLPSSQSAVGSARSRSRRSVAVPPLVT